MTFLTSVRRTPDSISSEIIITAINILRQDMNVRYNADRCENELKGRSVP